MLLLVWVGDFGLCGDPVADVLADPRKFVIEMEDYDFGRRKVPVQRQCDAVWRRRL